MNRISSLALLGLITPVMTLSSPAPAGDGADRRIDDRLEQMQAEIERLRQDNLAMRSELYELRQSTDENWLTERRADEIRGLVADVLADADTRASLLGDGLMAGWRDGFFLASPDGRFLLRIQGQMQFRYMYSYHDTEPPTFPAEIAPDQLRHARGFENSRTRLVFRGHVFDRNLQYLVRGAFQHDRTLNPQGGGFYLLDAWMRYHFNDEWSLRAGQFKLPFSREFLVFSGHQLATERSLIDTNLNIGRSQGVELTYADDVHRVTVAFSDGAEDNLGQFGPPGIVGTGTGLGSAVPAQPPSNTAALRRGVEYAVTGRYEFLAAGTWRQFEDFTSPMDDDFGLMFGIAGSLQRDQSMGQPGGFRRHSRWFSYTVDGSAEFGGANLFASFTHHYADSPGGTFNIFGVVAQGGFYITPKWEAFARYEWGHWSADIAGVDFQDPHIITVGANYYLDGHDAKWTTDIGLGMTQIDQFWTRAEGGLTGWRTDPSGSKPQVVFRTQFQLLF